MIDLKQMVDNEIADAHGELVTVPPQRAGWAYRELQQAGIQPQARPNEDGSHTFAVKDAQTGAILANVIDYMPGVVNRSSEGTELRSQWRTMLIGFAVMVLVIGAIAAHDIYLVTVGGMPFEVYQAQRGDFRWLLVLFGAFVVVFWLLKSSNKNIENVEEWERGQQ